MEGKLIELFIPGELKEEPVIYRMIKDFDIEVKIIEASFSAESGWALLIVNGSKAEMQALLNYLDGKGIGVDGRD